MESTKRISIVIVTYNSSKLIKDCLQSIYDYNDIKDCLEVIIVDNASKDIKDLVKIVNSNYPDVKIINNERNGGYGQGNNVGIQAASGDYILIMNPDARFKEPILHQALSLMESRRLVLLGMKQWVNKDKKGVSFRWDDYSIPSYLRTILTLICNRLDLFLPSKMYLVGACFFLDKCKFLEIGAFDENIFMYNEESDIRNRIIKSYGSKSISYIKNLNFIHLSDDRPFSSSSNKRVIDSLIYYANKYKLNTKKILKTKRRERKILYYYCKLRNKGTNLSELMQSIDYMTSLIKDGK